MPQPGIAPSGSAPSSALAPSLTPGLIPTQLHKEFVWGAETNCIKLKKKRKIKLQEHSVGSVLMP